MNFQTNSIRTPLKVLFVNPLTPSGQMSIIKILNGAVFGLEQLTDIILLVYSNERAAAEELRIELIACAYPCFNTITVSSDLPSISDADVFCFMSNFANPNKIDIEKSDIDEQFDALYLIIKVANNLSGPPPEKEIPVDTTTKNKKPAIKSRKPIFMADGIAVIDILKSISKDVSADKFFCPSAIPDVARAVLADHLKVQCDELNHMHVWAANDEVFHVEIEKPIIKHDNINTQFKCDWDMISKKFFSDSGYDRNLVNPSWLKKEFIQKVAASTSKNPYGCIFRAAVFTSALKSVWASRISEPEKEILCNMGVISDGSLGTLKGYPYILPLRFSGESCSINNTDFEENVHLRKEIKRINKTVKEQHQTLIPYCKKFLLENVINQAFIPVEVESETTYSLENSSKTSSKFM